MKIKNLKPLLFLLLTAFQLHAQSGSAIKIDIAKKPIQEVFLNGSWGFMPAIGINKPSGTQANFVDAKAQEIFNNTNSNVSPFQIKVPQFLNRVSWWLPHVSDEFEEQETARIKALPFKTDNLRRVGI